MIEISDKLLKQRLRNRVMEALECFADKSTVEKLGTVEIINIWFDWVGLNRIEYYDSPVFLGVELSSLYKFHGLVEKTYKKVPETWKYSDLENVDEWNTLCKEAQKTLAIFQERGFLSEETEIT